MTKEFEKIFGITIRDQVIMKNSVHVKGLGTFSAEHINQEQKTENNGAVVMMPPKDTITFKVEDED